MSSSRKLFLKSLLVPATLVLLWLLVSTVKSSPLFPGPFQVLVALFENTPVIVREIGYTLWRAFAGFAIAVAITLPLGVVLGRFQLVGKLVEPVMDMIATLPPVAVIPLVMLFAGTGDAAKISVICYAAAVPLLMNTYEASRNIDPLLNRVARSLGLNSIETMLHVDLPASLPMIATGARLAIASSFLVSITSEILLSTNGIGVYLQRSQETFKIAASLAGIVFISLAGLLINAAVARLEKRWLFWHYRNAP